MPRSPHATPVQAVHGCRRSGHDARLRLPALLPFVVLIAAFVASEAHAVRVTQLTTQHRDGQTFITWVVPAQSGIRYRVYRSATRINSPSDFNTAELLGSVGDSTWCDRRLSMLTGVTTGFRIDSLATPLKFVRGLFVTTADQDRKWFYAVTCEGATGGEDRTIAMGQNSIHYGIQERIGQPRPIYQRTIQRGTLDVEVYTLWVGNRGTPLFPVMANRASVPYDCAMVRGEPGQYRALVFRPHVRGGNFLEVFIARPDEWSLTMDDWMRTPDINTFWFGYHENYDIESDANLPPTTGEIHPYTQERIIYTLEWARRNFPIDPTRIYVNGSSMGGICGVFLSMARPDLIAASMVIVPRVDFSFTADLNDPPCAFNIGESQRATCDRLWGAVNVNLPVAGTPIFDRLNASSLARGLEDRFVPPMVMFAGRNDNIVGWAEKIPFFRAMGETRAGGTFFWDTRDHWSTATSYWEPLTNFNYLYRFRTDLSFPALSNASSDQNPGNGLKADGDSVGTINGFIEWDSSIVDEENAWRVTLRVRDLESRYGLVQAPDLITVDVTPRRLQRFQVVPNSEYLWTVRRASDGTIAQTGAALSDARGLLTLTGVNVIREGSALELRPAAFLAVEPGRRSGAVPVIAPLPSPVRGSFAITVNWPAEGPATLDLIDLAGRQVARLDAGAVTPGSRTVRFDGARLPSGVYFLSARQNGAGATRRVALVH